MPLSITLSPHFQGSQTTAAHGWQQAEDWDGRTFALLAAAVYKRRSLLLDTLRHAGIPNAGDLVNEISPTGSFNVHIIQYVPTEHVERVLAFWYSYFPGQGECLAQRADTGPNGTPGGKGWIFYMSKDDFARGADGKHLRQPNGDFVKSDSSLFCNAIGIRRTARWGMPPIGLWQSCVVGGKEIMRKPESAAGIPDVTMEIIGAAAGFYVAGGRGRARQLVETPKDFARFLRATGQAGADIPRTTVTIPDPRGLSFRDVIDIDGDRVQLVTDVSTGNKVARLPLSARCIQHVEKVEEFAEKLRGGATCSTLISTLTDQILPTRHVPTPPPRPRHSIRIPSPPRKATQSIVKRSSSENIITPPPGVRKRPATVKPLYVAIGSVVDRKGKV